MYIEKRENLEHDGTMIEAPKDHPFLPNDALKVSDYTDKAFSQEKQALKAAVDEAAKVEKKPGTVLE